jgi:DNA-binding CsgD family transcriptional regulator
MDAYFSWRKTRASDLPACLNLHPAKNGAEVIGRREALKAWQRILEMRHATRSVVVELHSNGKAKIVGFALSTFVKKSFAEAEVQNPRPGLNSRILESVLNRNSVIATYEEVREANTRGNLEQMNLDTSWSTRALSADQVNEVRILLGSAYPEMYCGYTLARVFMEVVDEMDSSITRNVRAFKTIKRFEGSRETNSAVTWYSERALIVIDAECMRDDPLSAGAAAFQRRARPQFDLTRGEQELLELALDGMDDSDAAKALNVSLPAVKHRWANIFERVAAVRPDVCPLDVNGTRGIQKRQRVLTYLRKHPEELRPFDFSTQESE